MTALNTPVHLFFPKKFLHTLSKTETLHTQGHKDKSSFPKINCKHTANVLSNWLDHKFFLFAKSALQRQCKVADDGTPQVKQGSQTLGHDLVTGLAAEALLWL